MILRLLSGPLRATQIAYSTLIFACVAASAACSAGCDTTTSAADKPPRQMVVVIDFSGSRAQADLEHSREMIQGLVQRLQADDQMAVMAVVDGGPKRSPARLHTIPKITGDQKKKTHKLQKAVRDEIRDDVQSLFEDQASMSKAATNLLSTLFQVRDYILAAGGRQVDLIVLSDMIQDAANMDFTHVRGVPTSDWIAAQSAKGLVPDLHQVCVTVVGADTSTAAGAARRTFWQNYFKAAGADLATDRYRQTLTQFDEALCKK